MGYDSKHYPDCTWKPYAATSAFNTPIKAPPIDPRSDAMMAYTRFNIPQNRWTGAIGTADYMHPIYWATAADPLYAITLTQNWGTNPLQGAKVRMPAGARPAGGGDGHLGIVQPDGTEVCLWQAHVDETRKTITASWGGRGSITGDGTTVQPATAAWFGLAWQPRACELAAANIDHALFCVPTFVDPGPWAPAKGNAQTRKDVNWPNSLRPHTGQRLWLDLAWSDIDMLVIPPWQKAVLRALNRYGAYVGDTGHYGTVGVSFNIESQQPYVTFLGTNPLRDFAASLGASSLDIGPLLETLRPHFRWLGPLA